MARIRMLQPGEVPGDRTLVDAMAARGAFINLYGAMAHSPVALHRFIDLLGCLWDGALTARVREIAILSVVSASNAPYPLGWHILDAAEAGLSDEEISAIVTGHNAAALPTDDAAIATFARSVAVGAQVDDGTFASVARFMDERQIVELTLIAGIYRAVACIANALDVDLDAQPANALKRLGLAGA